MQRTLASLIALSLSIPSVGAQTMRFALRDGDPVSGVGAVNGFSLYDVASDGRWGAWVTTDNPDGASNTVLLVDGAMVFRENDPVAEPVGWRVRSVNRLDMLPGGDLLTLRGLRDGAGGTHSGVYHNAQLLLQVGSTSTAAGFPAGSTYGRFDDVKFIDVDRVFVLAQIQMPGVFTWRDAMIELRLDASGALLHEEVLWQWGDALPGQTGHVLAFNTEHRLSAVTRAGEIMWGGTADGPALGHRFVYHGDELILQAGDPSPWPGAVWATIPEVEVATNARGDWAFKAPTTVPGSSFVWAVMKNGAPFVRQGNTIPDIEPHQLTFFSPDSPIHMGPTGDVIWHARWDEQGPSGLPFTDGLFVNRALLAREGGTLVEGTPLVFLGDSSRLSPNGRYLVFDASTSVSDGALVLAELSIGQRYCDPVPNSTGAASHITAMGSAAALDNDFRLRCDDMPLDSFAHFFHSMMPADVPMAGGSMGTLCVGGAIGRLAMQIQNSGTLGAVAVDVDLTALPTPTGPITVLAGQTWHFSCWYRDFNPTQTSNFSDGVSVTFI